MQLVPLQLGFEHDNLYCEWVLDADPLVWKLINSSGGGVASGEGTMTAGVSQISRTTVGAVQVESTKKRDELQ
jgi:hypothetical protein